MRRIKKLHIIECRGTNKAKWRPYGGSPHEAFDTKKAAQEKMRDAIRFNFVHGLRWKFRVTVANLH